MSKELKNEVSGVRTEDILNCMGIMQQLGKSIRGDKSFEEAWEDELYRSVYRLEMESYKRSARHELKKLAYCENRKRGKLMRSLYDRMATYYHRGYVDGDELPGISWSMESNGLFVVTLTECALNMEHTYIDTHYLPVDNVWPRGTVYNVWLDVPDMEDASEEHGIYGNYHEYVGFTCDFGGEHKSFTIDPLEFNDNDLDLIRDTLADFDVIDEMMGRK